MDGKLERVKQSIDNLNPVCCLFNIRIGFNFFPYLVKATFSRLYLVGILGAVRCGPPTAPK